jgi:hypothetical protein
MSLSHQATAIPTVPGNKTQDRKETKEGTVKLLHGKRRQWLPWRPAFGIVLLLLYENQMTIVQETDNSMYYTDGLFSDAASTAEFT